jgi:hypothetical protein
MQFQLGEVGQIFRTSLDGQLDAVGLTEGLFAGYAVGVPNPNVTAVWVHPAVNSLDNRSYPRLKQLIAGPQEFKVAINATDLVSRDNLDR